MNTSAFALAAHEQGLAKTHASVIGVSDSALALKVLACEQPNGAKMLAGAAAARKTTTRKA